MLASDFNINAIGPVVLFQAFLPLLQASSGPAKFVAISSLAGMITGAFPLPLNSYGASKAALNFLVKKMDVEYPGIVAFPIQWVSEDTTEVSNSGWQEFSPGVVSTDMGRTSASALGAIAAGLPPSITPEESASSVLSIIDQAEKASHGGRLWNYDGQVMPF
jgi:norsolorinic acid ketoreductase